MYFPLELDSVACLEVAVGRYMDSGREPRIVAEFCLFRVELPVGLILALPLSRAQVAPTAAAQTGSL